MWVRFGPIGAGLIVGDMFPTMALNGTGNERFFRSVAFARLLSTAPIRVSLGSLRQDTRMRLGRTKRGIARAALTFLSRVIRL